MEKRVGSLLRSDAFGNGKDSIVSWIRGPFKEKVVVDDVLGCTAEAQLAETT